MYNVIQEIENIIEEIETNITSDIDYGAIASKMALSVYEFRRIFAFLVGCPISEYVRKRRLSLAACELKTDCTITVEQIGQKYGYSTPPHSLKLSRNITACRHLSASGKIARSNCSPR